MSVRIAETIGLVPLSRVLFPAPSAVAFETGMIIVASAVEVGAVEVVEVVVEVVKPKVSIKR